MNRRLTWLGLTAVLAVATSASATTTDDTVNTSNFGTVRTMGTINTTYSEVFMLNSVGGSITCGTTTRIQIARAHARHQLMYDTLLAAKLSGRSVEIDSEIISNVCWIKQVKIQ